MATPGDPYETVRLDDLRTEQRRRLRAIDADVLNQVAGAASGSALRDVPWYDARRLESELRDIIAREMVHIVDLLARSEESTKTAMAAAFLRDVAPRTDVGAIDALADELSVESHRIAVDGLSHRERVALERFVLLAIWADQLAGDYSDPRLVPG